MRRPVAVEPVKVTMSTMGFEVELVAHLAVPGDHVEHAGRDPRLGGGLGDHHGVERRPGVRLEDHGAAGREGRRHLHDVEHEGEVERRDGGDHADGLTDEGAAAHPGGATGRRVVLDPGKGVLGQRGVRPQHPDRARALDGVGEESRRARLGDDQLAQVAGPCLQDLRHRGQLGGALRRLHVGPGALVEGAAGRLDGAQGGLRRGLRDGADHLLGGGVEDVDRSLRPFGGPRSVNEQLVIPGHFVVSVVGSVCLPCPTRPGAPDRPSLVVASQSCPTWRTISSVHLPGTSVHLPGTSVHLPGPEAVALEGAERCHRPG